MHACMLGHCWHCWATSLPHCVAPSGQGWRDTDLGLPPLDRLVVGLCLWSRWKSVEGRLFATVAPSLVVRWQSRGAGGGRRGMRARKEDPAWKLIPPSWVDGITGSQSRRAGLALVCMACLDVGGAWSLSPTIERRWIIFDSVVHTLPVIRPQHVPVHPPPPPTVSSCFACFGYFARSPLRVSAPFWVQPTRSVRLFHNQSWLSGAGFKLSTWVQGRRRGWLSFTTLFLERTTKTTRRV